ncbi:MAG: hypothetical protein A3F72_15380 [Bacteroidetes bacterium RIFCSPLOWO2_12_FULL_35_15]|nr:MAG: hypothetical protein A3F72_15380 [Bacteroidetes bacterium RIFCSPLOWO2_12_FULL_35_15]
METTVNERIALLKTKLNLGTNEFSQTAGIAAGTVWNIENGGNVSSKTIKSISKSFNVNIDWLKTGKGKMMMEVIETKGSNPWQDEAYVALKDEVSYLRTLVSQLIAGKGNPNFLKALDVAKVPLYLLKGIYSGANAAH